MLAGEREPAASLKKVMQNEKKQERAGRRVVSRSGAEQYLRSFLKATNRKENRDVRNISGAKES
jgi:hypothetical protein